MQHANFAEPFAFEFAWAMTRPSDCERRARLETAMTPALSQGRGRGAAGVDSRYHCAMVRSREHAPPLADRMRPRTLDELLGQGEIVGPGTLLRSAIERDDLQSLIFWGPPGSGKTTLARIIAAGTKARFLPFSAVTSGIKEIKEVMKEAEDYRKMFGQKTIVFIDE